MTLQQRLDSYIDGFEPVRLRDWVLTIALPFIGLIAEAVTDWDTGTGWFGLGAAIVLRLSTRSVRNRTTSMAKLDAKGIDTTPLYDDQ